MEGEANSWNLGMLTTQRITRNLFMIVRTEKDQKSELGAANVNKKILGSQTRNIGQPEHGGITRPWLTKAEKRNPMGLRKIQADLRFLGGGGGLSKIASMDRQNGGPEIMDFI